MFQRLFHLRDDHFPVGLTHGGGEMEADDALLPQLFIQESGLLFGVAHHQQAGGVLQYAADKSRDLLQPPCPRVHDASPPEGGPESRVIGDQLFQGALHGVDRLLQTGLGSGAEYDGGAADVGEKVHGQIEQRQHPGRYGLNFVDDQDAAAQGLEAADTGGPAVKEGVQQLDQGGDNDRRIPVFGHQFLGVQLVCICLRFWPDDVGVVFQNQIVIPDVIPQDLSVLIQNTQQGRGENEAGLVIYRGVGQGKAEGGQGLAAAGGDVQPVDAAGPVRCLPAPAGDFPPGPLNGSVVVKFVQFFLHSSQQLEPEVPLGIWEGGGHGAAHIARRVIAIPLDDGGEQQPGQKAQVKPDFLVAVPGIDPVEDGSQLPLGLIEQGLELLHPGALLQKRRCGLLVGAVVPLETPGKAEAVVFIRTVKQPVVGACGKGQQLCRHIPIGLEGAGSMELLQEEPSRGVCMDHRAPPHRLAGHNFFEIPLISGRLLPAVVQQPREIPCFCELNAA